MQRLDQFLGPVFEEICRDWLLDESENGAFEAFITNIGSWWGGNPETKKQEEIDIIATTTNANELLLGECKWTINRVGAVVIETLIKRASLFSHQEKKLFVFAREDFSTEAMELANKNNIQLITFKEMMDSW